MPMLARLRKFLDANGVRYEVRAHRTAFTAQEVAAAEHLPGKQMAKVVMMRDDGEHLMVVLPAPHHVDLGRLGKAVGADLREGKITLPLIAALDRASGSERERIQHLLALRAPDPEQIEEIRLLVMKHKGVEYALDRAHVYAQTAKSALHAFPPSEDRETLTLIADFVVDRDW